MRKFYLLISCLPAVLHAQTPIYNQSALQSPATFNISGQGKAHTFMTTQATGAGGNGHFLISQAENGLRWAIGMNTEETGTGEEGSNFSIYGYGNGYLGEYMSIRRSNGYIGFGVRIPQARLQLGLAALENSGLTFGQAHEAGNIQVPLNASTGGYNIDFHTWRDIAADQIGARIRAERINIYQPNNALMQGMDLVFQTSMGYEQSSLAERMRITRNGNIGIGTAHPDEKLAVNGTVKAQKVKVTQTGWADFVFDSAYQLPPLARVEEFVRKNRHLPDIPSEKEVAEEGVDVGEMNRRLLQKVEELVLYIIQQDKEVVDLKKRLASVETSLSTIKK